MSKPIFVTKPSLPPLDEFMEDLKIIWESEYITNSGSYHELLEKKLADYLGVKYVSLFSNGTLALITALQALKIKGDVITTPYSFVATTNALIWNGINPVFVDIEDEGFNICTKSIEKAITENTEAIMPVHVYGIPCNVDEIEKIAKKHKLKVIYDAAHAFGINHGNQSLLNYGDLSILSFHATKVFNTIEGGAIISHSKEMKEKIDNLKNFGIVNEETVVDAGINAKMNELQAAYGLINLKYVDKSIAKRRKAHQIYTELLSPIKGINLVDINHIKDYNFGYFPVIIGEDYPISRDELHVLLKKNNIFSRRYFYPLISNFPIYSEIPSSKPSNLPKAQKMASSILCLPMYETISEESIANIVSIIKSQVSL